MSGRAPSRRVSCALAAAALLLAGCGGERRYDPAKASERRGRMEERIGSVLAEEALAAVAKPGRAGVVLAAPDTNFGEEHRRIADVVAAAMSRAGVEVTEWTLPGAANTPGAEDGLAPPPVPLTGHWLVERVRGAPGGIGIVISLADAPAGEPGQLPAGLPPLVCLAPVSGQNIGPLMKAGAVKAAIVPRRAPVPEKERDWFEIRYTVVRPDTVDAWMQAAGSR